MTPASRVLIVDRTPETRAVLRALVERVGAEAVEANRPEQAIALAKDQTPDLIVLDTDSDRTRDHAPTRDLGAAAGLTDTPIVVLGALDRENLCSKSGEVVAKPYHYAPLVRKIEALLAARRAA